MTCIGHDLGYASYSLPPPLLDRSVSSIITKNMLGRAARKSDKITVITGPTDWDSKNASIYVRRDVSNSIHNAVSTESVNKPPRESCHCVVWLQPFAAWAGSAIRNKLGNYTIISTILCLRSPPPPECHMILTLSDTHFWNLWQVSVQ